MRNWTVQRLCLAFAFGLGGASLATVTACGDTLSEPLPLVADSGTTPVKMTRTVDAAAGGKRDARATDASRPDATDSARSDATGDARAGDGAPGFEADAPRNHGDASSTYPAFPPDVPSIQSQGGPTLESPQIVTVTWPDEQNAAALEAFGDDLGTSSYWAATTHEYGVGAARSGPMNHVRLAEQPINAWTDVALEAWLTDHAANYAKYGLPAPNGSVIYTLYLSTATDLSVSGSDGCQQGIGGYHSSVVLGGGDVSYAVILQCDGAVLNEATSSASHELVEAATDPHPTDIAGYYGFDGDHLAWDVFQSFQDEVADACEFYYGPNGAFYTQAFPVVLPADAGADGGDAGFVLDAGMTSYSVQRTWSNVSAAGGHHPCVPAMAGPYYAVTPLAMESVTMNLSGIGGASRAQSLGYNIAKGATKTFAVGFHSDAPTSGPWTISAREGNPVLGGSQTSHLSVSIDVPTGANGDISYVTVTVNAVDTSMDGELLTIVSQLPGGARTYVPILIGNQ